MTAVYDVAPNGEYRPGVSVDPGRALRLRFAGASHGIAGLPENVSMGPRHTGLTGQAQAYLMLPTGADDLLANGLQLAGDFIAMYPNKPAAVPAGHHLYRIVLPRRIAVDLSATLRTLPGIAEASPHLAALQRDGRSLLLPRGELHRASIDKVYRPSQNTRELPPGHGLVNRPLGQLIPDAPPPPPPGEATGGEDRTDCTTM